MTRGSGRIRMVLWAALCCFSTALWAQEEGSAELTTEVVQDVFQESFFDALKEKSIGNLDKALSLLMRCKEADPEEAVVNYELGRIFLEQGQYPSAESHLLNALKSEPSNVWYLHAGVQLYLEQEALDKAIALAEDYQGHGWEQQLLLSGLYLRNGDYQKAEALLNTKDLEMKAPLEVEAMKTRMQVLMDNEKPGEAAVAERKDQDEKSPDVNSVEGFRTTLSALAQDQKYDDLLILSNEAVSNFPAQPEFYYFKGVALLKTNAPEKALEAAEEGLAYLLEDNELELAFYQLMKDAYEVLGNDKKRKELENRIGQKGS